MRDDLLGYYERELVFLRQMGAEFAQKYPKIASRLLLEADRCEDPHVERMIEGFAFLAGRVRLKVDDDFPEITESFLNVLYPHYLSPIPSMSIVQFTPKAGSLTSGYEVPRGTGLYSRPVQDTRCRFRTGYPATLWPITVDKAALESLDPVDTRGKWGNAVIKLELSCLNQTTLVNLKLGDTQQPIDKLRFYLSGEPQIVYPLYEMIFNHATRVELQPGHEGPTSSRRTRKLSPLKISPLVLPPTCLRQVGFEADEALLQYTARSFAGYRLLSEYFALPEKFLFFDVTGLAGAAREGFGSHFQIQIYLKDVTPIRGAVGADTFQLNCAPVINLFSQIAEPIHLSSKQHEYHVIPDVRQQMTTEVYSVDSVVADDPQQAKTREFQPFYSFRHAYEHEKDRSFWYPARRQSLRPEDQGTEVYLSLVDLGFNPRVPASNVLTVRVTCTNRDLPEKLPWGGKEGDLEVEGPVPVSRVHCLTKPTPTFRPPLRRGTQWRLISHLTLNHLSLVNEKDGVPDALQEVLFLYDLAGSQAARRQITGISRVTSRPAVRQTGSRIGSGFVRGIETTIVFDEEQYVGGGLFLFSSVLERFLGLYASINSFNQLVAVTKQSEGILKRWPPRAGEQILL